MKLNKRNVAIILLSVSSIGALAYSVGRATAPSLTDALEECRRSAWHELQDDVVFNAAGIGSGKENHNEALADCNRVVELDPSVAEGYERLGVIYWLPETRATLEPSNLPLAIQYFQKAEAMGSVYSAYALAKLALSGRPGTEALHAAAPEYFNKAVRSLTPGVERGSIAAKTLVADLILRGSLWFPYGKGFESSLAPRLLREVAAQKSDFLTGYYMSLGDEGVCRNFGTIVVSDAHPPPPPAQNATTCYKILKINADAGNAGANLNLGITHIDIAKAIARERQEGWQAYAQQELSMARNYLLVTKAKGDKFDAGLAENIIAKIDNVDFSQASSEGSGFGMFMAAIVGLAMLSGGDSDSNASDNESYDASAGTREAFCSATLGEVAAGTEGAQASAAWGGCYDHGPVW